MATTDSFQGYMFQGFSGLMRKLKGEKSFESDKDFIHTYRAVCEATLGKSFDEATPQERYTALARMVAFKARDLQVESNTPKEKRVYYFSLEFLLGPLLDNYLINLGVRDVVADGLKQMGTTLEDLCAQEADPGLGNGGLGRLAACFLDSMATEGFSGNGNGMRYRYGLFRQEI